MTEILTEMASGSATARDELFVLVYEDLRARAIKLMRGEVPWHTLQATALVDEAYLRLAESGDVSCENRAHFLGVAARAMRQVLVDHARQKKSIKHGGKHVRVTLNDEAGEQGLSVDLLALDEALRKLEAEHPRHAQLVELCFFSGLNHKDVAHSLGISERQERRDWSFARAWLRRFLGEV